MSAAGADYRNSARLLCIEFGDSHAPNLNLFNLGEAWHPSPGTHRGRLSTSPFAGIDAARSPLEFALCFFGPSEDSDRSTEVATVRALLESGAVVTCLMSSSVEVTRLLHSRRVKSAWKEQLATKALQAAVGGEELVRRRLRQGPTRATWRDIASVLRDTGANVITAKAQHLF
jgi:hypothetical protein